jgi:tRNA 5-methylaminomethyl-2-thiouridine biosynthesis bifunctional protein
MQKNILIIGAGIAGCSLAHFLANTGWTVTLLEGQDNIAQGGSGNPVAAIYPKFMLNDQAYNDFMLKSFIFTTGWIEELKLDKNDYKFNGAIEILDQEYAHKLDINLSKKVLDKKIMTKSYNVKSKYGRLLMRKKTHMRTHVLMNRIVVQYSNNSTLV